MGIEDELTVKECLIVLIITAILITGLFIIKSFEILLPNEIAIFFVAICIISIIYPTIKMGFE